ncbi:hypothetical protein SPV_2515 [Streptococcus pneumoniae]|nr:hypothetical protein SPV_2515 [Streptococcus pneumoniae]
MYLLTMIIIIDTIDLKYV